MDRLPSFAGTVNVEHFTMGGVVMIPGGVTVTGGAVVTGGVVDVPPVVLTGVNVP